MGRVSTLERWMEANQHYAAARDLTYSEMPKLFRLTDAGKWTPRKYGWNNLARINRHCFRIYYKKCFR